MPNVTPNYGFYLPLVNNATDQDLWGGYLNDNFSELDTLIKAVQDAIPPLPIGSGMDFWGASAPAKWLLCYGQAISRVTYAALFAVIGTTYGAGDGVTTFNLPDKRGRATAGKDNMGGTSANRLTSPINGDNLGAAGGTESVTLTITEMPLHGHAVRRNPLAQGTAETNSSGGFPTVLNSSTTDAAYTGTPSNTAGQQIGGTGGGQAHNNVQPTIVANYIIYAGV